MAADVELERVSRLYGSFKAVDDVSLAVREGSFISLLGSSGAGKSTILRMIGGFELPDYGTVRIAGRDVTMLAPYRRDVNTVFQNYALFPHMNAAENVAYGLRQDGVPAAERKNRVRQALDMVEMLSFADRKPNQLSGGQQQRIALARALVKRPSVLLLDEPLGALDRKLRQQMQVELKLLQSQLGITFIFVTHDQEEALAMSDSIAVMRHGRIEQLGAPSELYERRQPPSSRASLARRTTSQGTASTTAFSCVPRRTASSRPVALLRGLPAMQGCWAPSGPRMCCFPAMSPPRAIGSGTDRRHRDAGRYDGVRHRSSRWSRAAEPDAAPDHRKSGRRRRCLGVLGAGSIHPVPLRRT